MQYTVEYKYTSSVRQSLSSILGAGAPRELRGALSARAWICARRGANYAYNYLPLDSCMQRSWIRRKPYTKFSWHDIGSTSTNTVLIDIAVITHVYKLTRQ